MLPRIVISQTSGSIAIDSKRSSMYVKPGRYEAEMKGNADSSLKMRTKHPKIQIDQTETFASAGIKKPLVMALENFKQALQDGIESIATIAQESLEFLKIEAPGNPIAEQAARIGATDYRLTIKAMPSVKPEITVDEGTIEIDAYEGPLEIDWKWIEPHSEYTPYEVKIEMENYPTIEITVEPGVELQFPLNPGTGANIDKAV